MARLRRPFPDIEPFFWSTVGAEVDGGYTNQAGHLLPSDCWLTYSPSSCLSENGRRYLTLGTASSSLPIKCPLPLHLRHRQALPGVPQMEWQGAGAGLPVGVR